MKTRFLFRCLAFAAIGFATNGAALAHHTKMSVSAASKLDAYDEIGPPVECLPDLFKRQYALDNYHLMIILNDGRLFLGEMLKDQKCGGFVNGNGIRYARHDRDKTCRGDAVISTTFGGYDHLCYFLWFKELRPKNSD